MKPTKINIPDSLILELQTKLESNDVFTQIKYPEDLSTEFCKTIEQILRQSNPKIKDIGPGWINATRTKPMVINGIEWHHENEKHLTLPHDDFVIMWVAGETNQGGEFLWIDNDGNINTVPLEPTQYLLLNRDTPHAVNNYTGTTPRISVNLNVKLN